jgi:hypothetical protein
MKQNQTQTISFSLKQEQREVLIQDVYQNITEPEKYFTRRYETVERFDGGKIKKRSVE